MPFKELRDNSTAESSAGIRARVQQARVSEAVPARHIAEAVQYRSMDRNYWT